MLRPMPVIDWDAKLAETLAPLAAEAFPIATWDVTTVLASCYVTTANFIKTVKVLTAETDESVFRRLIHRGNAADWWEAPSTCTPIQMYKFCTWLRSPQGAACTNDQRRLRRLEKKAFAGQTSEDICYLAAMDAQLTELNQVVLMREKEGYAPASAYVSLQEMEMGEKCYKLYIAEYCTRQGMAAEKMSELLLRDVRDVYGDEVAAMHKTEYMRDEKRRNELKVWLAEKIIELERAGENRRANKLRFYLNMTGGEVSSNVRALKLRKELLLLMRESALGSRRRTISSALPLDASVWFGFLPPSIARAGVDAGIVSSDMNLPIDGATLK